MKTKKDAPTGSEMGKDRFRTATVTGNRVAEPPALSEKEEIKGHRFAPMFGDWEVEVGKSP